VSLTWIFITKRISGVASNSTSNKATRKFIHHQGPAACLSTKLSNCVFPFAGVWSKHSTAHEDRFCLRLGICSYLKNFGKLNQTWDKLWRIEGGVWHLHHCIIDKRILIALCADRAAFDNRQIRSRCC